MSGKYMIIQFVFMTIAFAGIVNGEDVFGMRLTTERQKPRENTQYLFRYFVKDDVTGDYKTQEETKEGDSVHGSYTIAEPNGDLRTVTYKAGPGRGFEATIDVQPSGSPMKTPSEQTTVSGFTEKVSPVESNVKNFPGGFMMDILSKPPSEMKTEMGMKFSLNPVTEPVPDPKETFTVGREKTTEKPDEVFTSDSIPKVENATFPTEGREISDDSIERELDEVINSMPKLPELVLADNKTHLKFHKDPEEALIDERITQIARQLAETGLRREYEERKLGHFIPISVRPVEHSTSSYLSKSFKFTGNDVPDFRPSDQPPLPVLTQIRVVPQYIYEEPKFSPVYHRLPVVNRPPLKPSETKEDSIATVPEGGKDYDTTGYEYFPIPMNLPYYFQFYPWLQMAHPQRALPQSKSQYYVGPLSEDLTAGVIPVMEDATFYPRVSMISDKNIGKS